MEESEMSFPQFMGGIEENLTKLVKENAKVPQDMFEHWQAFSSAIDWNENWIRGLLAFHVICFIVAVGFRRNIHVQTFLFLFISALVFLSERINSYCAQNWRLFSKQNYFDKKGIFSGIFFSGPLLAICFFQLVSTLLQASSALVIAKRYELREHLKKEKNKTVHQKDNNSKKED
mmetsp:Transcript_40516/g.41345  ORF Transcript_40516/g.41345 Transcript_40516/m.41345 type:complete len:175 (-) Transcript_40516:138-662(-)